MITQDIIKLQVSNNSFIPPEVHIIINRIIPDAKVPGIGPEIVMIDKGNRTKDQTVNQYNDQKWPVVFEFKLI